MGRKFPAAIIEQANAGNKNGFEMRAQVAGQVRIERNPHEMRINQPLHGRDDGRTVNAIEQGRNKSQLRIEGREQAVFAQLGRGARLVCLGCIAQEVEHPGQDKVGRIAFDRHVEVAAGLAQRGVKRIVTGNFFGAIGAGGVEVGNAVALGRVRMVTIEERFVAFANQRAAGFGPGMVVGFVKVQACANRPVQNFFVSHIRITARLPADFITGIAARRKRVEGSLVVGEGKAALVVVCVLISKMVENVFDHPGLGIQFVKQVVNRQVEGVEHHEGAFIDHIAQPLTSSPSPGGRGGILPHP